MKIKVTLLALFFVGFAMLWIPRSSPLPPGLIFAQINQPGGGGGSGTVTSVLGTANQITSDGSSTTPTLSIPSTFIAPGSASATSLACGVLNTTACVLTGYGSTSGTATLTWPAVAGTTTNPIISSNAISVPAGSAANPGLLVASTGGGGLYGISGALVLDTGPGASFGLTSAVARFTSATVLGWGSGDAVSTTDTSLTRSAAGVVQVGSGASAASTGKLKASGYISVGTKFTTNNGCTDSATAGGATAGTFTVGTTTCTEVVTMGDSATAPNGWSCTVVDITTLADVTNPHQTTSSATTATFVTGTVVSGDKIQFSCVGY